MSRLENHAMLRDSATECVVTDTLCVTLRPSVSSQCALLEKYGLAIIEGVFYRGKLIF